MIVFQVFIKFWSTEWSTENTMSHLYLNEESDNPEEIRSTILHNRKKLNMLTSQLPIYYMQY